MHLPTVHAPPAAFCPTDRSNPHNGFPPKAGIRLRGPDTTPSRDHSQWLNEVSTPAYRCGGSTGFTPASRFNSTARGHPAPFSKTLYQTPRLVRVAFRSVFMLAEPAYYRLTEACPHQTAKGGHSRLELSKVTPYRPVQLSGATSHPTAEANSNLLL